MDVFVAVDEHANLDSLPLRYGVTYEQNTTISLTNIVSDQLQKNGRNRIVASFTDNEKEYGQGVFVVDKSDSRGFFLVTCWRNDRNIETEHDLSECMTTNRKAGYITTNQIQSWHENYMSGELKTKNDLIALVVRQTRVVNSKLATVIEELNRSEQAIWSADFEIEVLTNQVSEKNKKITQLSLDNEKLSQNIFRLTQSDKSRPNYRGEEIGTSSVHTLERVEKGNRTKANGQMIRCTRLYFSDHGVGVRTMDEWADKSGAITARAEELVGCKVVTTTWRPEVFAASNWFRNIAAAE